jgi:hypothetical protein
VAATDLELGPARTLGAGLGLSTELVPAERFEAWTAAQAGRFDCIFALDVLEHVGDDDLARLGERFRRLLRAGGRLVVSGPTESVMYQVGRLVAGFRGAYHRRSVFDVARVLDQAWRADETCVVPRPPLPVAFHVTRYRPANG